MSTSPATPSPRTFGRYREIAVLGRGGMARVVLATLQGPLGVQKLLVIKEMLPDLVNDPEMVQMFIEEARLASRLDHPNLIQTFEVGESDGRYFLVMEFLDGQTLGALLTRTRREVPLPIQLHVLSRVLGALHYVHDLTDLSTGSRLGIVHRDVSPQNIVLCYGGAIKLVDFGIAKVEGGQKTRTGVFKGKAGYAAPEQIGGDGVDRRADVFACGVLLWEALAGKRISSGVGDSILMQRRVAGLDPKILEVAPSAAPELAAICDRAMSFAPEDRFATAGEMLAAIETYQRTSGHRTTDADVGELVGRTFETERSEVRRQVAEGLAASDRGSTRTISVRAPAEESLENGALATGVTAALAPPRVPSVPSTGSRLPLALAVGGAIALTGGLIAWRMGSTRAPVVASPIASVTSPSATAAVPPAASVELSLRATPDAAQFTVDGTPVEGNPATLHLPRGGGAHTVETRAAGYLTEQRQVVLDRDLQLDLVLRPAPAPSASASAASPPAARPRGTPGTTPAAKAIDTADPWKSP